GLFAIGHGIADLDGGGGNSAALGAGEIGDRAFEAAGGLVAADDDFAGEIPAARADEGNGFDGFKGVAIIHVHVGLKGLAVPDLKAPGSGDVGGYGGGGAGDE